MADTRAQALDRVSITSFADTDCGVIQVGGELDVSNAGRLTEALEGLERRGATTVTVMVDELTFLDCGSARIIGAFAQRIRSSGGTFAVTGARRHVAAIFDITGHHDVLGDASDAARLTGASLVSFSLQGFVDASPVFAEWDGAELTCSPELFRAANLPPPNPAAGRPTDEEDILCALVMLSWACDPVTRAEVEFGESA